MSKVIIFLLYLSVGIFSVSCGVAKQEEPESCVWNEIQGKCVLAKFCLTSLDRRGEKPPVCVATNGVLYRICCTDCTLVNDTSNFIMSASGGIFWKDGRKARDACLQYLKEVPHVCHQDGFYSGLTRRLNTEKKCHEFSLWGIGGAPPPGSEPPSENPYEALIGFGKDLESARWMTAGAIISEKFILTSAHGHTTTDGEQPLKYAAVGVKNRKSDKKDWQIHTVKTIYQHPEYKQQEGGRYTRYNDIALLELETPITFNGDVLPACLPIPTEEFDIESAKFSSWKEKDTESDKFLDTSHIIRAKELTAEECDAKIREVDAPKTMLYNEYLPEKIKSESQLCYGNKDTCMNIDGGPVVVTTQYSRCMNTVIGVNAYGYNCGPTVFTKVQHFVPWIESIVWP